MAHVFISYCRENQAPVDRLAADLQAAGVAVWLDRGDIAPGSRWKDAIQRAIQDGSFFIACFSAEYDEKPRPYMNEELTVAIDELRRRGPDRIWFIPVLLPGGRLPDRRISAAESLADLQAVDLGKDWDRGVRRIVDTICPAPLDVQILRQALGSSSAAVRLSAAAAAAGVDDRWSLELLIVALSDPDDDVFRAAAEGLRGKEPALARVLARATPPVPPAVIRRLIDESHGSRNAAASALVWMGAHAVPHLVHALEREQVGRRERVVDILGEIGDTSATPVLVRLLDDVTDVAICAAWHLFSWGTATPGDLDALRRQLRRNNPELRANVALAMARLGDRGEDTIAALIEALRPVEYGQHGKEYDPLSYATPLAAEALGEMGAAAESALPRLEPLSHLRYEEAYEVPAKQAIEKIMAAMHAPLDSPSYPPADTPPASAPPSRAR